MSFSFLASLSGFSSVTCGGIACLVNGARESEPSETEPSPDELATPSSINDASRYSALQQAISYCSP